MSYETCPLLDELSWLRHGFFNRFTPVENTLTDVQYFSAEFKRTFFLPQTHSDKAITLMEKFPEGGADACYTDRNDIEVALAVKTADCCPVLIACTRTKSIAAIHAGWPGVLNKIVQKTIHQMMLSGADPTRMIAALGPCLQQDSFEVRADLHDKFSAEQPEIMDRFQPVSDGVWKLDSVGIIEHQLKYMGVFHIWKSAIDTKTHPDYFSYRNRATDPASENGRNVSLIMKVKS